MFINCKCGIRLTKDLCLTSGHEIEIFQTGPAEEDYDTRFKPGFFTIVQSKPPFNNKWRETSPARILKREPKKIRVSKEDLLITVPKMTNGYGCCDWSFGHKLHCSCGNVLGKMYFDCYEEKCIDFIDSNVIRRYHS